MEPFRIIPTRRRLRSSKMTLAVEEKGDLGNPSGKASSPHPDPSTLAKEMEEFEKLMQLDSSGSVARGSIDAVEDKSKGNMSVSDSGKSYKPDQPTEAPDIPYEPDKPTDAPEVLYDPDKPTEAVILQHATKQLTTEVLSAPYEPEYPTTVQGEEYVPEEPTAVQEMPLDSEPYEPEQPTEEIMDVDNIDKSAVSKNAVSEVEADMPQLTLDFDKNFGKQNRKDAAGESVKIEEKRPALDTEEKLANTSTSLESASKSEQENLIPEVWLRKREKRKHSGHSKHKKPLVEWRLGVIRKDYVRKDLTKFPVDEKLMATTKHKWNNESEVEHLKVYSVVDSDATDASEVSGMTSPADLACDTEPELERDAGVQMEIETNQNTICDVNNERKAADGSDDDTFAKDGDNCVNEESMGDGAQITAKPVVEVESNSERDEVKEAKSENKGVEQRDEMKDDTVEKEEIPNRMSTRQSSRRTRASSDGKRVETDNNIKVKDESRTRSLRSSRQREETDKDKQKREEDKDQSDHKENDESKFHNNEEAGRQHSHRSEKNRNNSDPKEKCKESGLKVDEDLGRRKSRRSERYRDCSDDEKSKKYRESDLKKDDSSRKSRRSDKYRDDSDDERYYATRDTSSDSRRRSSRRNDGYRDDSDDDRRDSRDVRQHRSTSRERRRHRDDDNRYDRYDRDSQRDNRRVRSRERSEGRRYRDDERRHDHPGSREKDDRKTTRKGRDDEEKKEVGNKTPEKAKSESLSHEVEKDVKKGGKENDKPVGNEQSSQSNNASKSATRMPIKFNFTSRRNTRSTTKPKGGVFGDENEEDDKPSYQADVCVEKVKDVSQSQPSDSVGRVTRSRSKVTSLKDSKSSLPPVLCTEVPPSASTSKAEDPVAVILRKDSRKDVQESESDSGVEFGLMSFNDDAPRLYPETILHSQLEMEILASAFSSTDTEPDTETDKPNDVDRADEENVCNTESLQLQEDEAKYFSRDPDEELQTKRNDNTSSAVTHLQESVCDNEQNDDSKMLPMEEDEHTPVPLPVTVTSPESVCEEKNNIETEIIRTMVDESNTKIDSGIIITSSQTCEDKESSDGEVLSQPRQDVENAANKSPVDSLLKSPERKYEENNRESSANSSTDSDTDAETSIDITPCQDERETVQQCTDFLARDQSSDETISGTLEQRQMLEVSSPDFKETKGVEGEYSNVESSVDEVPDVEIIDLMEGTACIMASSVSLLAPSESLSRSPEDQSQVLQIKTTLPSEDETVLMSVHEGPDGEQQDFSVILNKNTISTINKCSQNSTVQEPEGSCGSKGACGGDTSIGDPPAAIPQATEDLSSDSTILEEPSKELIKHVAHIEQTNSNNLPKGQSESSSSFVPSDSGQIHADIDTQAEVQSSAVVAVSISTDPIIKEPGKRKRKSRWAPISPEQPNSNGQIDLAERPPVASVENENPAHEIAPSAVTRSPSSSIQERHDLKLDAFEKGEISEAYPEEVTQSKENKMQMGEEKQNDNQIAYSMEVVVPSLSEQETYSSPSKITEVDKAKSEPAEVVDIKLNMDLGKQPEMEMDLENQDSVDEKVSPVISMGVDGAGDNKANSVPVWSRESEAFPKYTNKEQDKIIEAIESSPVHGENTAVMKSGDESMEEGELPPEASLEKEDEKEWDESDRKEQGEIVDDGSEGTESLHQSRRGPSQNKEDISHGHIEKPKESRESREERRRLQYKEWGFVERGKIPKFVELEENLYLTERRRSKAGKEARRMVCCCTTSREERRRGEKACGEDCLNRVLMIECGSRCPCGEYCTNRRFQRRENARVGVFYAEGKGHGLKAKEDLKENAFVMEYVGEVLNPSEFRQRAKQYSKGKNVHFYFMALKADEIIDATEKGNFSRFMNHSCDPNCETQKWTVNGQLRVGFFTRRPVQAGTELTFDYQFEVYGQEAQACLCGSDNCRGVIGKQKKQKEGRDTPSRRRGSVGERRRKDSFEDVTLDDEIQQMVEQLDECGLQSNDHTIAMLRFMVRADQQKQRLALLKILQESRDSTYLKYFLTHHGLRLLWSWMVDLGENPQNLQLQILLALSHLPIPNRNVLEDSKVLSVIERWSRDLAKETEQEQAAALRNDSDVDSSSASETPSRSDTPMSAAMAASLNVDALKSIAEAISSDSDLDSTTAPAKHVSSSGQMESSESLSSTRNDTNVCENPSSSEGEGMRTSLPADDDSCRQPDSASDSATLSSKNTEAQHEFQAVAVPPIQDEGTSADEVTEAAVTSQGAAAPSDNSISDVDSTSIVLGETKEGVFERNTEMTFEEASSQASGVDPVQSSNTLTKRNIFSDKLVPPGEEDSSELQVQTTTETASKHLPEVGDMVSISGPTSDVESDAVTLKEHGNEAEMKSSSCGLDTIIASLLHSWSDLKEIYRIPKKDGEKEKDRDRDHDRDRHRSDDRERDRRHDRDRDRHRDHDRGSDRSRDRDDKYRSRDSDRDRHRDRDRDRDKDRDRDRKDRDKDDRSRRKRSRSRSRERETKSSSWSQDSEATSTPPKLRKPWKDVSSKDAKGGKETKGKIKTEMKEGAEKEGKKLSKEERRALFEMEVEAKEREEAARKEQELLMMAQWEEREQAHREQMSQYLDPSGFPMDPSAHVMDPNAPSMMMNEHGMPIEVLPSHMGMGMGGMAMGEEYMGHPDMQGQYQEHMQHPDMQGHYPPHMQQPDHRGMEGGYPHPHMHEQTMQTHPEQPALYDDRGFPILPQEHIPHGSLGMPHSEMQHPGMEYSMHPDADPNAIGQDPTMMGEQIHPGMIAQHHPNVDPHLLGGQAYPGNPPMLPPDHLVQENMVPPQQDMLPPQVVAPQQAVMAQPAPSEEELMPPPSLPAPKKTKAQKSQQKVAKESSVSTYVAPAPASSRASPVPPQATAASSVPQGYAAQQTSTGVVPVAQAPQVMQPPVLPQHPQQAAQTTFTFVTPDGMLVTQTITPLAATEPAINPNAQQMQQHSQVSESIPSPPAKPKTTKLPPKWKTAQDAEGKTYYYHSVTRQTQWEPPQWDEAVDGPFVDDSQGSGSSTPTYDEKNKQRTTTAPADTSSEAAKKLKEAFRSKMSHHVVSYLNVYRKPECKLGRITNTEDFKHLARKLTHGIMAKELKHCRNIEDLEVNENVKHKAKEYIKKYMARFGKVYKKDTVDIDF